MTSKKNAAKIIDFQYDMDQTAYIQLHFIQHMIQFQTVQYE